MLACETDEIGIYDSVEELRSKHACWESCGIVEIETSGKPEEYSSHMWLIKQDLRFNPKMDYLEPEITTDPKAKKESDQ